MSGVCLNHGSVGKTGVLHSIVAALMWLSVYIASRKKAGIRLGTLDCWALRCWSMTSRSTQMRVQGPREG